MKRFYMFCLLFAMLFLTAGCSMLAEAVEDLSSASVESSLPPPASSSLVMVKTSDLYLSEDDYLEKMSEIVVSYAEMKESLFALIDQDDEERDSKWWEAYVADFASSVEISDALYEMSEKVPEAYRDNHAALLEAIDLYTEGFSCIADLPDTDDEEAAGQAWDAAVDFFGQADELWVSVLGEA